MGRCSPRGSSRGQVQHPVLQGHGHVRRRDVDLVRLHPHAVPHLGDRHPGNLGQDLRQHAVGPGRHVLYQDKAHAGVVDRFCKSGKGLQPAGRGADPHYLRPGRREAFSVRLAAGGSRLGDGSRG